jgi:hypothetical protein
MVSRSVCSARLGLALDLREAQSSVIRAIRVEIAFKVLTLQYAQRKNHVNPVNPV